MAAKSLLHQVIVTWLFIFLRDSRTLRIYMSVSLSEQLSESKQGRKSLTVPGGQRSRNFTTTVEPAALIKTLTFPRTKGVKAKPNKGGTQQNP